MKTRARLYLDSCCFIDLVKDQVGMLPKEDARERDVWFLKQLMKAHEKRDVELFTSFLTIAECVAVEAGGAPVPVDIQDRIRRLITSGQYVSLMAPTPMTGRLSQDLRWKHRVVLAGADALHIASAIEAKCQEFLTTDERLLKPKLAAALPVIRQAVGLSLIPARSTKCLPDEYRQGDMLENKKAP